MFRKRMVGALASFVAVGALLPTVANAQEERVVAPTEKDAYVSEFHYDPEDPPVINGVKALTEREIAEYQEKIREAQASGPPQDRLILGEMWSDKVGLPEGVDKAEADQSEITIAAEQAQSQKKSLRATTARCQSFWLTSHQVCGAILDRYEKLGGMTSWLLLPIEGQSLNPDGEGYRQRFAGGYIYWHPQTGAHAVANHTANVWQRHGWEAGWLGYPLGGEVPVEGATGIDGEINGWVQHFQGGRIYRSPVLEGYQIASVNGLILDKWIEMGGPDSELGFPIADEAGTPDGQGRFSIFQNGSIYWHPAHGAHVVNGAIAAVWHTEGAQDGPYGYPISDSYLDEEANVKQDFSEGSINLKDFFTSDEIVTIEGEEVAQDYIDFLKNYLNMDWIPGSSSPSSTTGPMVRAAQAWYPAQNSDWQYEGRTLRVVSPILIPENYTFDINHPEKTLHDFCSYSQDLWGEDTKYFNYTNRVSDFRGPCANHDMCYETTKSYDTRVITCDPSLRNELKIACREAYGTSVTRANCWATAESMYQVVKRVQGIKNGEPIIRY